MMDPDALITINPKIMLGKPCIRGSRITVEHVLNELASGMTVPEMLYNYPTISEGGIRAALSYAAAVVSGEEIRFAAE